MARYIPSPRDWVREQVELYESSGGARGTIANAALGGHIELSDLQQEGIRAVRVAFPSVGT